VCITGFYSAFTSLTGSILVQTFIFSPLSALCNSGFRQATKSEINGWFDATAVQQSKMQLKRLENEDNFKALKYDQIHDISAVLGYRLWDC